MLAGNQWGFIYFHFIRRQRNSLVLCIWLAEQIQLLLSHHYLSVDFAQKSQVQRGNIHLLVYSHALDTKIQEESFSCYLAIAYYIVNVHTTYYNQPTNSIHYNYLIIPTLMWNHQVLQSLYPFFFTEYQEKLLTTQHSLVFNGRWAVLETPGSLIDLLINKQELLL